MAQTRKPKKDSRNTNEIQAQKTIDTLTAKKKKGPLAAGETTQLNDARAIVKKEKFARLAVARVGKAIKAIEQIAALGGAGYSSTENQRKAVLDALNNAVADAETRLSGVVEKSSGFTLPTE